MFETGIYIILDWIGLTKEAFDGIVCPVTVTFFGLEYYLMVMPNVLDSD